MTYPVLVPIGHAHAEYERYRCERCGDAVTLRVKLILLDTANRLHVCADGVRYYDRVWVGREPKPKKRRGGVRR